MLTNALKYYDSQSHVDSKVQSIDQSLSEIWNVENRLSKKVEKVDYQFTEQHKSITNMLNSFESKLKEPVKAVEQELNLDEYRDREGKKFNVVILTSRI